MVWTQVGKVAHEPGGPHGRSLSRFLLYEATESIATPPWTGCYLITWNFRDTFISRFWGAHISRHFNFEFAILRKFCVLNHFNFAFLIACSRRSDSGARAKNKARAEKERKRGKKRGETLPLSPLSERLEQATFLSKTHFFSLAMLFYMSLNETKRLYQRYDNVKINTEKRNSGTICQQWQNSSSHNVHKQFMLVRELLVLSQLTTISIYIENSFLPTPKKKWCRSVT